jgi:ABC-type enterochelin transport system substrate-binding protein
LLKFEPKDLLDIQVPNLNAVSKEIINDLCSIFDEGKEKKTPWDKLDKMVHKAAKEAANHRTQLF